MNIIEHNLQFALFVTDRVIQKHIRIASCRKLFYDNSILIAKTGVRIIKAIFYVTLSKIKNL